MNRQRKRYVDKEAGKTDTVRDRETDRKRGVKGTVRYFLLLNETLKLESQTNIKIGLVKTKNLGLGSLEN